MAIKIVKAVNLLCRTASTTTTGVLPEKAFPDKDNFNGSLTWNLEIVTWVSSGGSATIVCEETGGTDMASISVSATAATRSRAAFSGSPGGVDAFQLNITAVSGTLTIIAARILIFQDAGSSLTATETQFEIGNYETGKTNTAAAPLTYPKYWTYTSANWDGSVAIYVEVVYLTSSTKGQVVVRLEEDDGSWGNWGVSGFWTIVLNGTATAATRVRVVISPTDGRHYRLVSYISSSKYSHSIFCGKIIVVQTGTITKTECPLLLVSTQKDATGRQSYDGYYDPAEWEGVTKNFYHEIAAIDTGGGACAVTAKLQEDPNSTPADIDNSSVSVSTTSTMVRGGSAMTMPGTAKEIDTNITAVGATDYLTLSRIVGLIVTAAGPANIKTIDDTAKASIKTVLGTAIGSIKTINGVAYSPPEEVGYDLAAA